ncbi:RND family efflux transporter MFP subunit [Albidovulum inexpectatum]|uniref:RND family efflux transporter MFP subunit n=1 Tax=Albidovulum inexpectatum TaxID=196587 RepID=A0A2S5JM11_9RHOB|nr:efflux RND transporter periplasmic adaptor subunit [Albidovulum inexpectatum]PPB82285.1 RND family efflux transporter MFP subunit [Albidovulum inexpectatum]
MKLPIYALALVAALSTPLRAAPPLAVEIVTAEALPVERSYSLTGEARARDSLSASFPTGGRIAEILVDVGDKVDEGAILARLESVQQEQALVAAEAGLSTARADYRQAVEDLRRQEALLERGATTRIARDQAEDALRIAEGALAQAEAQLDRARKALEDTVLRSPGPATVTARWAEPGEVIGAAQPVLELAIGDGMEARFDVPEIMLTEGPTPGPSTKSVILTEIDGPETEFTGHLTEVSPVIDPHTGTVVVIVEIDNPPPTLSYGDPVRGTVTITGDSRIAIPWQALTATAEGPAVWTVNPDTMQVSLTPITVERYENGLVYVGAGLQEGAMVVGRGAQLLYPGRQVTAAEAGQ